jgi:CHAD domain-containing protein
MEDSMHEVSQDYLLPPGPPAGLPPSGLPLLGEALTQAGWRYEPEPTRIVSHRLLDSFDWGCYLAGAALEEVRKGGRRWLLWHDLKGDRETLVQSLDTAPGLARDLPTGPVQGLVRPAIGLRRLCPVVTWEVRREALRLMDAEGRALARLALEEYRVVGQEVGSCSPLDLAQGRCPSPAQAPPGRLRLTAAEGGIELVRAVADILETVLSLTPAPGPLVAEMLAVGARPPGGYSTRLDYRLDPDQPAGEAAREILLGLRNTVEVNIPGTREHLDAEFLHDLRVATRRTRAALAQIPGVLPAAMLADFRVRFVWLQQVTGPARDLEVYLEGFDDLQAALPPSMRPDLEPLRGQLRERFHTAQWTLTEALASPAMNDLLHGWRAALLAPLPPGTAPDNAARPIKALADARIWRMLRRVRVEGRAIRPESPAGDLHELRKSCKKLRYLMEFFQSLYPIGEIGPAIKTLKVLLDDLGGLQDLAIQAGQLTEVATVMHRDAAVDTRVLLAMGALVADLLRRQGEDRAAFAAIFRAFDAKKSRDLYRGLFGPRHDRGHHLSKGAENAG